MKTLTTLFTTTLAAALLLATASANDEAGAIQNRRGNASPVPSVSNINEYTYQDEQINLGPNDEDVLVLRTNEKVLLNRYVTKTIPLRHVHPREIRGVLREMTAKEGGRAEVIRDKNSGENFLQVVAPKWQIPFIEQAIATIDQEWVQENMDGSQTVYFRPKYRRAAVVDSFARNWGGEGSTEIDQNNNALVRRDEPYRIDEYLDGAALVDVPEHQGRFHVKVYEVTVSNDLRLGLDYVAWKNGPGRNLFGIGAAGYYADQRYSNMPPVLSPFGGGTVGTSDDNIYRNSVRWAYGNFLLTAAYVDFLSSKGKAKTLAEGTVQVRSGDTGIFSAADQVVSFVERTGNQGDPEGESADPLAPGRDDLTHYDRTLNREVTGEVGIFINIAPVILKDSTDVVVSAEVSSVAGYTPQGLPIINETTTATRARLQDGQLLVLAGLNRDEKVETKAGMPYLSELPVLGYLFGGENNIDRQTQIVIVIEALTETGGESVLADPEEINTIAAQVTGESIPEVPKNPFGFDMWLLGENSGGQI
jgi:type II secretory pathway component GspD/PulD (secretin)